MRTIFYLMSGTAHLPYLVASLWTLRRHWRGPVIVFAWPESFPVVVRMAEDTRLGIVAVPRVPAYRGKNDQFLDKIQIAMTVSSGGSVLYLDADTTIHGDLSRLFDEAESIGFCATQFCDWLSCGSIPRGRIRTLVEFPDIPVELIERAATESWCSVNGGVWACLSDSPVLKQWYAWTWAAKSTFIADEKVLHLMQLLYPPRPKDGMTVLGGGRWNCSPIDKFWPSTLNAKSDVVVWHYHGDSNVRPDKSLSGFERWWGIFSECIDNNVGGVATWWGGTGNKWIARLPQTVSEIWRLAGTGPVAGR